MGSNVSNYNFFLPLVPGQVRGKKTFVHTMGFRRVNDNSASQMSVITAINHQRQLLREWEHGICETG